MKIYFAGSIRGGRQRQELYASIISVLAAYGEVLTEHVSSKTISHMGEKLDTSEIFERDMNWLREADVVIAEVTIPSLGVGYEIAYAESRGKPVLCLYEEAADRSLSAMIAGNSYVTTKTFTTMEDIKDILRSYFAHVS